jgi:succinate dehydrogenase/fumarate reductase flavoprotein subunit
MSHVEDTRIREWPYPVRYDVENQVSADVLVVGGGIAGCHAAISAAKKGAKVVVVDKGPVIRSGSGGAGVDHWHGACTNPCSKVTPEEMVEVVNEYPYKINNQYGSGALLYIMCKESYDALLDVEKMGVKVRDVDDEFVGAEFRDEKTRLMFAYDYENKHTIRVQGANMKPSLYKELKRLNIDIFDHVMGTSLLTEGGGTGSRVVGATGVNVRTGEFYVFTAKATVLATAKPQGLYVFSSEIKGSGHIFFDPNCAGDGTAMAWRAGAEFSMMEWTLPGISPFGYPPYGTGNAHNTWFGCRIVDANGKEVPWVDRDGRVLETLSERFRPAPGQQFFVHTIPPVPDKYRGPELIPDLPERIKKGEFTLPLYADLPSMPEHERRGIFGLMVGNEGKTRIPIYKNYTEAGFDPDKDMLQASILPAEEYRFGPWNGSVGAPQCRELSLGTGGGLIHDWDLRTTLDGLYGAGMQVLGGGADHALAATSGRYAGRKAAEYALGGAEPVSDKKQVEEEKARVYAPVNRTSGIEWKELQSGLARIMQDYCGMHINEEILEIGLRWLTSIYESEAASVRARNPHELIRTLECFVRLNVGEMIMHASLARKASSNELMFFRSDYPDIDPPEWHKFVTIRREKEQVKVGERPIDYSLLPPNAPTYEENYKQHCGL